MVSAHRDAAVGPAGEQQHGRDGAVLQCLFPRLEEAIEYCDTFSLDELPQDATNLLYLIYSLIMVAMAADMRICG